MTLTQDRVDELRERHPNWEIRISDAGRFWGIRQSLTWQQLKAKCRYTVDADDPETLDLLLTKQDERAASVAS